MSRTWLMALIAAALTGAVPGRSQTIRPLELREPPQSLDLRQVALFKNGFGFFVGRATFPAGERAMSFLLPAVPVHGTFWLSYPADINLASVVAEKVESQGEMREAITIPEILRANVGRQVRITIDEKQISGRLRYFTSDRRMPRIMPYAPGLPEGDIRRPEIWPPYEFGLAIIESEAGTFSLDPRSVEHVMFLDGPVRRHFPRTRDAVEIYVQAAQPMDRQSLTVSFLAKGITWTPSYLVDISGEKKARLSAKALVVNEAYKLRDIRVQLVTGFPNLEFADVSSPIGMKENLAQFLQAILGGEREETRLARRVYAMQAGRAPALEVAPAYGAAQAGLEAQDLFLYPGGRLTLDQDRVAYIPLFTEAIPYEHLYQWSIPNYVDEAGQFLHRAEPPGDREQEQQVWHSLRLENTTKVPWTPAPAEVLERNMVLGQGSLPYTPSGDKATLRIARAANIKAEQREFEVERQREAQQFYGVFYDLVTVRGELSITNFREESITLEITKTLSGEVTSTDPPAKIEELAAGLQKMNGLKKLTWTLEIPPNEKSVVTYTYELYVRR